MWNQLVLELQIKAVYGHMTGAQTRGDVLTSCCLLLVQVASVWAVTRRATPSVTGWTAWRTKAGGWSAGTSWPTSCRGPSATTKPRPQTVGDHRDPLMGRTPATSPQESAKCMIIRAPGWSSRVVCLHYHLHSAQVTYRTGLDWIMRGGTRIRNHRCMFVSLVS